MPPGNESVTIFRSIYDSFSVPSECTNRKIYYYCSTLLFISRSMIPHFLIEREVNPLLILSVLFSVKLSRINFVKLFAIFLSLSLCRFGNKINTLYLTLCLNFIPIGHPVPFLDFPLIYVY